MSEQYYIYSLPGELPSGEILANTEIYDHRLRQWISPALKIYDSGRLYRTPVTEAAYKEDLYYKLHGVPISLSSE